MIDIKDCFEDVYMPVKAILLYKSLKEEQPDFYVESYDINAEGYPVNAHPLSMEEAAGLSENLDSSPVLQRSFLRPKGLMPENILHMDAGRNGMVIWYTAPQKVNLFFIKDLQIPNGKAHVPALVWKASKTDLFIYAITENKKPLLHTSLFYAPFFNVFEDGRVCMGTVDVDIPDFTSLEDFISGWQEYFFNSYFSHLVGGINPVNENLVEVWQQLINSGKKFPTDQLKTTGKTIKSLIP